MLVIGLSRTGTISRSVSSSLGELQTTQVSRLLEEGVSKLDRFNGIVKLVRELILEIVRLALSHRIM